MPDPKPYYIIMPTRTLTSGENQAIQAGKDRFKCLRASSQLPAFLYATSTLTNCEQLDKDITLSLGWVLSSTSGMDYYGG